MNSFLKINLEFVKFAAALDESAFAETDNTLDQVEEMDAMVKGAASSAQGLTNYLMNQDKGPSRENVPDSQVRGVGQPKGDKVKQPLK